MGAAAQELDQGEVLFEPGAGAAFVAQLTGPWHPQRDLASMSSMLSELGARPGTRRLAYETAQLTRWTLSAGSSALGDTATHAVLTAIVPWCSTSSVLDASGFAMTTDGNGSSSAHIAEAHIVTCNLATACGSFVLMSDLNS